MAHTRVAFVFAEERPHIYAEEMDATGFIHICVRRRNQRFASFQKPLESWTRED